MPWCGTCSRYLSPSTVRADGTCPECGRAVEVGEQAKGAPVHAAEAEEDVPFPWHLKLLAAAVVLYLGYRAWQGIEWLIH